MIAVYEITYILVCAEDGLVSHTIKKIREVVPEAPEDEEEDEDN